MKSTVLLIGASVMLAACTAEPAAQDNQQNVDVAGEKTDQDNVKLRQNSIEAAAEEATKIIEADAKAEIDSIEEGAQAK